MNPKFFHAMTSARRRRNHISKLMANNGVEVMEQQGMCEVARVHRIILQQ